MRVFTFFWSSSIALNILLTINSANGLTVGSKPRLNDVEHEAALSHDGNSEVDDGESLINGNEDHRREFKYVVAIIFNDAICTGSIINDDYVVTAGHCFLEENGEFGSESPSVVAGTNYIYDEDSLTKVEIKVEKVYVPSNYYRRKDWKMTKSLPPNDIAVLKLAKSLNIKENPNLEALSLPTKNGEETFGNVSALVAGYGYNGLRVVLDTDGSRHNEYTSDDRLHWAKTSVLNNTDCQGKHYSTVDDSQICAQMLKKSFPIFGTCHGDSGSPLVLRSSKSKILIGVQIGVRGCNEARHPSLYTKITSHVEFIELVLQGKADSSIAREVTLSTDAEITDTTDDYENAEVAT